MMTHAHTTTVQKPEVVTTEVTHSCLGCGDPHHGYEQCKKFKEKPLIEMQICKDEIIAFFRIAPTKHFWLDLHDVLARWWLVRTDSHVAVKQFLQGKRMRAWICLEWQLPLLLHQILRFFLLVIGDEQVVGFRDVNEHILSQDKFDELQAG
eukprot:g73271.t1